MLGMLAAFSRSLLDAWRCAHLEAGQRRSRQPARPLLLRRLRLEPAEDGLQDARQQTGALWALPNDACEQPMHADVVTCPRHRSKCGTAPSEAPNVGEYYRSCTSASQEALKLPLVKCSRMRLSLNPHGNLQYG